MPEFTIAAVSEQTREFQTNSGHDLIEYKLKLEGEGDKVFRLNQKPDTDPPAAGQTIDANVTEESSQYGPKLVKQFANTGGGQGGGDRSAEINRAVAFKGAVEITAAQVQGGLDPAQVVPQIEALTAQLLPIVEDSPSAEGKAQEPVDEKPNPDNIF